MVIRKRLSISSLLRVSVSQEKGGGVGWALQNGRWEREDKNENALLTETGGEVELVKAKPSHGDAHVLTGIRQGSQ